MRSYTTGNGNDSIVLGISEDAYEGDAEFTVSVDGTQLGGTFTATELHGSDTDNFIFKGNFGSGTHTVTVNFLNDAWGYTADQDRNLYVESTSANGYALPSTLTELSGGPQSFTYSSSAYSGAPVTAGSGADTLRLFMSEDAYQGDAQFTVSVDGTQVGGTLTATALHGQAYQPFDISGDFGSGPHTVTVNFLNDAWGSSASQDRNLYVEAASYNGISLSDSYLKELSGGPADFSFTAPSASAPDTLTLRMSEDAYEGDAQFTVSVDGTQVEGTFTATASEQDGRYQDFTLNGSWGSGAHDVSVTFLNDAYGGSPDTDRNLYVRNVTLDGVSIRTEMPLLSSGDTGTFTIPATQPAAPSGGIPMLGVNLSGAEYGTASGIENVDYMYPNQGELNYWSAQGMNVVRIPLLWERLQPVQGGDLDATQLSRIDTLVSQAAADGMKVDLDLHNYGYGYGEEVGSTALPDSALADFWGKMASHFADSPNVMYGIMNEPSQQTATQWSAAAQDSVTAIRDAGASGEILVSGSYWDGAHDWTTTDNASIMLSNVTDPLNNMAFEVHQYFDDNSGTSTNVASPTVGPDRMSDATAWARDAGVKMFLGEFGSGNDTASLTALSNTLAYMQANSDVWQGGTYWAGGPMEGSYMFNPDPSHGVTSAQGAVLAQYAPGNGV